MLRVNRRHFEFAHHLFWRLQLALFPGVTLVESGKMYDVLLQRRVF